MVLQRGQRIKKVARLPKADLKRVKGIQLRHPKKPVGLPWPVNDLRSFDAPSEGKIEINNGVMLGEVLRERGWKYSKKPCHGTFDKKTERSVFWMKEFEACLLQQEPVSRWGINHKGAYYQWGHKLKLIPRPKHALWMMGRMPFVVPSTRGGAQCEREDFIRTVVKHGKALPGPTGNYRIAKFPGTQRLEYKTAITEAFGEKSWYPKAYNLPRDKAKLMEAIRQKGNSKHNLWIGKPRNDYGGSGIQVWRGTDPELLKLVRECHRHPEGIMQQYLADPLLVGGYKFHMRIHMVITNVNPLQAYVQENGQCLFATKAYCLRDDNLGANFDPPVHVTNLGLNSKPQNKENFFRKKPLIGKGQQIRVKELVSHLKRTRPDFKNDLMWQQILDIAADTARYIASGVQRRFNVLPDRHFEIFGMDLMLDNDFKVWMCEVNTDPGLSYPDKEVLGCPNPDYNKEATACKETFHDMFTLLGLDAGLKQRHGSLKNWFELDFPENRE